MWDLERQNHALLRPGMRVHFEDITHHPVSVDVPKQITPRQDLTLKQPYSKSRHLACKFRFKMKVVFSTAISVWVQQGDGCRFDALCQSNRRIQRIRL
jgi:hypothetical protein